jgi:hypothetical protein
MATLGGAACAEADVPYGTLTHEMTQESRRWYIEKVQNNYPPQHVEGMIRLLVEDSRKCVPGTTTQRNAAILTLADECESSGRPLKTRQDLVAVLHLASLEMMVGVGW